MLKTLKNLYLLIVGVLTGILISTTFSSTTISLANSPIKLIVNGMEVQCDVPPQEINGRVLVPARPLAEVLGAKVEWDEQRNAVIVISNPVNNEVEKPVEKPIAPSIPTTPSSPITPTINTQTPITNTEKKGGGVNNMTDNGITETTYNGLKAIVVDGVTYFSARDHNFKYPDILGWDNEKQIAYIKTNNEYIEIENIPENIQQLYGQSYFNIKFYREN